MPKGLAANAIHIFNMVCDRSSIVRFLVRLIVAPIGIFYWLCLGPFEVGLTFYFNNIRGSDPEMKLQLSRAEDRRFIGYALILPVSLWGAISIIYTVAI